MRCVCKAKWRSWRGSFALLLLYSQSPKNPALEQLQKEFQIGLCWVVEADLELFCNCWSAGFVGERLYDVVRVPKMRHLKTFFFFSARRLSTAVHSCIVAFSGQLTTSDWVAPRHLSSQ